MACASASLLPGHAPFPGGTAWVLGRLPSAHRLPVRAGRPIGIPIQNTGNSPVPPLLPVGHQRHPRRDQSASTRPRGGTAAHPAPLAQTWCPFPACAAPRSGPCPRPVGACRWTSPGAPTPKCRTPTGEDPARMRGSALAGEADSTGRRAPGQSTPDTPASRMADRARPHGPTGGTRRGASPVPRAPGTPALTQHRVSRSAGARQVAGAMPPPRGWSQEERRSPVMVCLAMCQADGRGCAAVARRGGWDAAHRRRHAHVCVLPAK